MLPLRVIFVTIEPSKASALGKKIVENKLAACVNILPKVESHYWWEGKINCDNESLLIIKTTEQKIEQLIEFVKENHPFDVPEIIALPLTEGLPDYLDWIRESMK